MSTYTTPVRAATPSIERLLGLSDDVLERRLLEFIRESGIKFRSRETFARIGWSDGPEPVIARFWSRNGSGLVRSRDPMIWDLRAPLLQDEALAYCSILLWRRVRKYAAGWVGGIESAAITIVAGILAVNRAANAPPLNGFYLRKKRKADGLRRLLEGVAPPHGARVLLVDDLLNKGVAKRPLIAYCRNNGLVPTALLVVVDAERRGRELFRSVCPVESIFTRRMVLSGLPPAGPDLARVGRPAIDLVTAKAASVPCAQPPGAGRNFQPGADSDSSEILLPPLEEMSPEDVELVRLARDTVIFTALSAGRRHPMLQEDQHGSAGYLPFLGRYLRERGPVFTRISKREFKDGVWFNRMRGCQSVGLFDPAPGSYAEMTMKSAIVSATRARRVKAGPAQFHKPVWPDEIGDLSLFVYLVEGFAATRARTVDELISEGHEVYGWGLVAEGDGFRGVICGGLDGVPDVAHQVAAVCRKMQNRDEIRPHHAKAVKFTRMKGRWLWDPARPKTDFF